jgi:hypothetical protein
MKKSYKKIVEMGIWNIRVGARLFMQRRALDGKALGGGPYPELKLRVGLSTVRWKRSKDTRRFGS